MVTLKNRHNNLKIPMFLRFKEGLKMLDYIIAAAVIILAGTLFDVPLWYSLLMIVFFGVAWWAIGDD